MAAHGNLWSTSTISRKNRGLWTVYSLQTSLSLMIITYWTRYSSVTMTVKNVFKESEEWTNREQILWTKLSSLSPIWSHRVIESSVYAGLFLYPGSIVASFFLDIRRKDRSDSAPRVVCKWRELTLLVVFNASGFFFPLTLLPVGYALLRSRSLFQSQRFFLRRWLLALSSAAWKTW